MRKSSGKAHSKDEEKRDDDGTHMIPAPWESGWRDKNIHSALFRVSEQPSHFAYARGGKRMQIKFEILKKGDTVLNVWENHIAVQKKSGEVEIYQFYLDKDGLPRLSENAVLVTHGNGSISAKADGNSVGITTF